MVLPRASELAFYLFGIFRFGFCGFVTVWVPLYIQKFCEFYFGGFCHGSFFLGGGCMCARVYDAYFIVECDDDYDDDYLLPLGHDRDVDRDDCDVDGDGVLVRFLCVFI